MNTNAQGNSRPEAQPPSNAGINSDIQKVFAQNSPLSLLPQNTPPVIDPQKIANDIAVKKEVERIEANNGVNPNTQIPEKKVEALDPNKPIVEVPSSQPPKTEPKIDPPAPGGEPTPLDDPDGSKALEDALDGKKPEESQEAKPEGEEDPLEGIPEVPAKAEHWQKLKEKTKTYAQRVKEIQADRDLKAKELEEYQTGAKVPEVVEEQNRRIAELEPLEKIHNLKNSAEYRQKYIEPLNHIGSRLEHLANTYEVDVEVINKALSIKNVRQLDQLLVHNFGNTTGAAEVKNLILQSQNIHDAARQAERDPVNTMQSLQAESQAAREAEEAQRINNIKQNTRNAWIQTVKEIREEGKSLELIPGSKEHNDRFVTPIQNAASREYGALSVALANAGLKELPEDVAKMLSKMTLLAHGSAVNRERALAAEEHIRKLEETLQEQNNIYSPSLSGNRGTGSVGGNNGTPDNKPMDAQTAARTQLRDMGLIRPR